MSLIRPLFTESGLRSDPRFVRQDNLLGHKTYVLRHERGGSEYVEIHYAVDLQGLAIKYVFLSKGTVEVIEPTMIQLGEPDDSIFGMPNLPVNYEFYEEDESKWAEQSASFPTQREDNSKNPKKDRAAK